MKFHWKLALLFCLSFYMLLSYQNCGTNSALVPGMTDSKPNLEPMEFVAKISEDADLVLANLDPSNAKSCEFIKPDCVETLGSEVNLVCLKDVINAYYESLECAGFEIMTQGSCIGAISNSQPVAMEPVLIELTCINEAITAPKSLHLGTCYGEDIGFNPDAPSTGMRISAWIELGNAYPYSRQSKQVVFYPAQRSIQLDLYEKSEQENMIDACGKTKQVKKLGELIKVDVKN